MHIQAFDVPDYLPLRRDETGAELPGQRPLANELPLQLGSFLDAVAFGEDRAPLANSLGSIRDARTFRDKVIEYADKSYEQLVVRQKDPVAITESSTEEEKQRAEVQNRLQDQELHTALGTYLFSLRKIARILERIPLRNEIRLRMPDGSLCKTYDPNLPQVMRIDALQAIKSKIAAVQSQLGETDLQKELEAEALEKARAGLAQEPASVHTAQTGVTNYTPPATTNDNKWLGTKILGVTALTVSGLGLLALAVYAFEHHKHLRRSIQQHQAHGQPQFMQQPYGSQQLMQPQVGGFDGYNTAGLGPPPMISAQSLQTPPAQPAPPQPNLSAIGYTPGTPVPSMNPPQPPATFNPSPLYSYPAQ